MTQQPLALQLADSAEAYQLTVHDCSLVAKELRRLHGLAQRQPLTEEEIDDIWNRYCDEMGEASINDAYDIARAIEAAHGIKEKNT